MTTAVDDWNAVALAKLVSVLGPEAGHIAMRAGLRSIARDELRSAAELRLFAEALLAEGGFTGAVGGLLIVHAAMYGTQHGPAERVTVSGS